MQKFNAIANVKTATKSRAAKYACKRKFNSIRIYNVTEDKDARRRSYIDEVT